MQKPSCLQGEFDSDERCRGRAVGGEDRAKEGVFVSRGLERTASLSPPSSLFFLSRA